MPVFLHIAIIAGIASGSLAPVNGQQFQQIGIKDFDGV